MLAVGRRDHLLGTLHAILALLPELNLSYVVRCVAFCSSFVLHFDLAAVAVGVAGLARR